MEDLDIFKEKDFVSTLLYLEDPKSEKDYRSTHRLDYNGKSVFVKKYRNLKGFYRIKELILGRPCEIEMKNLKVAKALGLPVPKVFAHIDLGKEKGTQFLIMEDLGDITLAEIFSKKVRGDELDTYLKKLSELLSKMYKLSFLHGDLHLRNIVVRDGELFLVDLYKARFHIFSKKRVFSDFASVCRVLLRKIRFRDWIRFLKMFAKNIEKDWRDLFSIVEKEIGEMERSHRKKLRKKFLRKSKYTWPINFYDYFGIRRSCIEESILRDCIIHNNHFSVLKDSRTTFIKEVGDLVVKRYNVKHRLHIFRYLFSSRAKRAWINSNIMYQMGFFVPKPLAFLERRRWIFPYESYLISEKVCGVPINRFLKENESKIREKAIKNLISTIKVMHRLGVCHCDLKPSNILVGEGLKIYILDADSISFGKKKKDIKRIHFWLSHIDKTFLRLLEDLIFGNYMF